MASAVKRQVLNDCCAAARVRVVMVELEEVRLATALTVSGHVGTARGVTLEHLAPHIRGNAPPTLTLGTIAGGAHAPAAPARRIHSLVGLHPSARPRLGAAVFAGVVLVGVVLVGVVLVGVVLVGVVFAG